MGVNGQGLKLVLAILAICVAAPASAMSCERMWSPPGGATMWLCEGNPSVSTPVSFWKKFGMGMTWPNGNSHIPVAYVSCQYTYYPGDRHVTWQAH